MKGHRPLATALVLAGACRDEPDPPPIVWEGEHIRFGTNADESLLMCGHAAVPRWRGGDTSASGSKPPAEGRVRFSMNLSCP